jgi:orotidine-5'-phosphate decarboxylase
LTALVDERRSQVCLGLDPDPAQLTGEDLGPTVEGTPAQVAAAAISAHCRRLIEQAGPACVAVKPQLACFERLGAAGWRALEEVCAAARDSGLLVIADAQALFGETATPWGPVAGLRADAATANPLLGLDSLEPLVKAAAEAGAGVFALVRTSNPGAADLQDVAAPSEPLHERLAAIVDGLSGRLAGAGSDPLSGMGAVVGATEPARIARLRELMPRSIFLIPGVGAQGGQPELLGAAFSPGPAAAIIPASRAIASDPDPAAAAERLRDAVWRVSGG